MFTEIAESPRLVYLIGWAITHSLWQGTLIALTLALILRLLRDSTPNIRYIFACAALALTFICPVATASFFNATSPVPPPGKEINLPGSVNNIARNENEIDGVGSEDEKPVIASISDATALPLNFTKQAEKLFPWMIMVWLLGVMILSLRLSAGLLYTRRLIKSAFALPEPPFAESVMDGLMLRLKIKRTVRVLESALVKIPMTVGWLYPVILLPPSALLGLTPQQLQSIIAHELVHIKRYDFLVNLFQAGVETLLFYHPAARWISGKIRKEREFVCDDLTLTLCGDPVGYARALTIVARLGKDAGHLAAAATGGDLSSRIRRLLLNPPKQSASRPLFFHKASAVVVFLFLIATAVLAVTFRSNENQWLGMRFLSTPNEANSPIQKNEENDNSPDVARLKVYGDDISKENLDFRKIAVAALEGHQGSVIIMNSQTGQVYSIVNQEWALRRAWSPASVFKMITSVAGIEEKLLKYSEKGLGYSPATRSNLTQALAVSDNDYFKALGQQLGTESLIKYANQLGFGEKTGINYDGEISGYVPDSVNSKSTWFGASGGEVKVTPLQLGVLMSAIANGGRILVPQAVSKDQSVAPSERRQILINQNTIEELRRGLREAVENGTGKAADNSVNDIIGKTGTMPYKGNSTGLFTSYVSGGNAPLVVVIAIDGKNETGAGAAQIAGKIYIALGAEMEN